MPQNTKKKKYRYVESYLMYCNVRKQTNMNLPKGFDFVAVISFQLLILFQASN